MENEKVFSSQIVRGENCHKNDLYALLNIVPAKPLEVKEAKNNTCDFIPKTDKMYIPKRRQRVKVKTVRAIRAMFENDTYAYITNDLEAQQKYLLNKIRSGSSRNENTIRIAKKVLKSNNPLSRSTWQMLININPEDHNYARQFVLWNGKHIQVNGSHGGKNKLICKDDLAHTKLCLKNKTNAVKVNMQNKKKGLLRNSLAIKFKPGPLGRKKFLDDSHQKYHGDIELVDLPKPELVVQPTYGTALEPTISQFINNLRKEDGTITGKWAEFAVSVLGVIDKASVKLCSSESMTFDLKYKYDQHRILMRKDLDSSCFTQRVTNSSTINGYNTSRDQCTVLPVVSNIINKMLDAVEINLNQDKMFTIDENIIQSNSEDTNTIDITTLPKDKAKRKYAELGRLDVTVIQLPTKSEKNITQKCGNAHCVLGCICESMNSNYKFKQHCGREECMFDCKCDFSKYININSSENDGTDLIPGIVNIEDEINMGLAKEEQKFHQTVIVTGGKDILFKSEKWNSSKTYDTRYKGKSLNSVNQRKRELRLSIMKLNCENVEPWCMVHNLYKCFCKGKFTESSALSLSHNSVKEPVPMDADQDKECLSSTIQKLNDDAPVKLLRSRMRSDYSNVSTSSKMNYGENNVNSDKPLKNDLGTIINRDKTEKTNNAPETLLTIINNKFEDKSDSEIFFNCDLSDYKETCARVKKFEGRKYTDEHYKNTNIKIKEMEKNDKTLQHRIKNILNIDLGSDKTNAADQDKLNISENSQEKDITVNKYAVMTNVNDKEKEKEQQTYPLPELPNDQTFIKFLNDVNGATSNNDDRSKSPKKLLLSQQNKLVGWLEYSYKLYKRRIDQGLFRSSLDPPKAGKVALYSWDFILGRYRERKNLFLISKQTPYRIFMGVNINNPFFETCMNINEIRFADLHKYPQTVKNLLTNATDLKDNFCILRGLTQCWELVGSVTKVSKTDVNTEEVNDASSDMESNQLYSDDSDDQPHVNSSKRRKSVTFCINESQNTYECSSESDSSKWFVMTVENDFSEIRFFKKGFFVKYESIVKAINVSRLSGKTVRLSSQKCADKNSGPQFGVYAIPNANEYCVFIGPYEMQDSLGIETIKSILDVRKLKRTRGFWIVTNKVDNLKVIDNPFSFMPLSTITNNQAIPLENHFSAEKHTNYEVITPEKVPEESLKVASNAENKKVVKPIKIRKTNGFYHLTTDGSLKKISLQSPPKIYRKKDPTKIGSHFTQVSPNFNLMNRSELVKNSLLLEIPFERTRQVDNIESSTSDDISMEKEANIKITAVYSQKEKDPKINSKKLERGMLILKPEEINRKLLDTQLNPQIAEPNVAQEMRNSTNNDSLLLEEAAGFSGTLRPCTVDTDVCVISDDDEDEDDKSENNCDWQYVIIQCTNIGDLGWIWGRQNLDSRLLSFIVPGGEYSEFYTESEAFTKLNEELSAIIEPTKPFNLNWRVVDSTDTVQVQLNQLDIENLQEMFRSEDNQPSIPAQDNQPSIQTRDNQLSIPAQDNQPSIPAEDNQPSIPLRKYYNKKTALILSNSLAATSPTVPDVQVNSEE